MFLNTRSGLPGNQSFSSAESRAANPAGLAPKGKPAWMTIAPEGKVRPAGPAPDNSKAVNAG